MGKRDPSADPRARSGNINQAGAGLVRLRSLALFAIILILNSLRTVPVRSRNTKRKIQTMEEKVKSNSDNENAKPSSSGLKLALKIMLPIIVIGAGMAVASYLKDTGPKSTRRPPERLAPMVQVQTLVPAVYPVEVNAMGLVTSAREVELKSRVSGEIVYVHPEFEAGGVIKAGTRILRIDPEDYKLALAQKKKALADATYALKLELGRQEVAKREWELLGLAADAKEREIELALRKPHLEKARAELAAAEAEVKKSELDLSRTEITIPFNAMVLEKKVDLGSQVTNQETMARVVGTDSYRVMASVPIERLSWIDIPQKEGEPGSKAGVTFAQGSRIEGRVVRLMGDLSSEGRMARVLIEVEDPLMLERESRDRPPLLLGEYVRVQIEGRRLEDVFEIPRSALRDNAFVWTVGDDDRLKIREVQPVWKDERLVLVRDGLEPGMKLIVSDLGAPVDGMPVQLESKGAAASNPPTTDEAEETEGSSGKQEKS